MLHVISWLIIVYDACRGSPFFGAWCDMGLSSLLDFSYDHIRSAQINLGWTVSISISSITMANNPASTKTIKITPNKEYCTKYLKYGKEIPLRQYFQRRNTT